MLNVTTGTDPLDPVTVAADADANRPDDWRDYLDPGALEGARIGYYESAFVDPRGTSGTVDAQLAALEHFEDAGATLVEISDGPSFSVNYSGDRQFTGWQLWIDDHPNSPYQDPREILGSQLRLPYRRSTSGYNGSGMMSEAEIDALLAARAQRKEDVADWLDDPPDPIDPDTADPSPGALDAVVFPGLKSVISLNDGGSAAFGRGDPPTNSAGAPSVAFPATVNDHGEPTNLQLVGRAWQDPELIGFAYAFDQVANGQIEAQTAPALDYAPLPADPTGRIAFPGPRKVAVRRNRVARVKVRCVGAPACATTLRLRSGGKQIARTALRVDAGPPTTARLRLKKRAMKRLRRNGELRATLLAVVGGESGARASSKQLTLTFR